MSQEIVRDPDLAEVGELVTQNMARPTKVFSADYLAGYLRRPTGDADLSLGLYSDGELVAYLGAVPYLVSMEGRDCRATMESFWVTKKGTLGSHVLKAEMWRLHKEKQILGGCFSITIKDSPAERIVPGVSRLIGTNARNLREFGYLINSPRTLRRRVGGESDPSIVLYDDRHAAECRELMGARDAEVDVSVKLNAAEMGFVFRDRPNTRTWLSFKDGRLDGLLNAILVDMLHENHSVTTVMVDHMVLPSGGTAGVSAFLAGVLGDPYWDDVVGISIPASGQWDEAPLQDVGFQGSFQRYSLWHEAVDPSGPTGPWDSFNLHLF